MNGYINWGGQGACKRTLSFLFYLLEKEKGLFFIIKKGLFLIIKKGITDATMHMVGTVIK